MANDTFTRHGKDGLVMGHAGRVSVDRAGLWSGTVRYFLPPGAVDLIPKVGSEYKREGLEFLVAEKVDISFSRGMWEILVDYAGSPVDSTEEQAQYEMSFGVGLEPIETHAKFVSRLAGKPSAPLNGAVFLDPKTGWPASSDDAGDYEFRRFAELKADGTRNPFSGVKSFYDPNNVIWKKSWVQKNDPADRFSELKVVDKPPGFEKNYKKRNWLEFPVSYTKRGNTYACSQQWMLSGRMGWNRMIYDETTAGEEGGDL